MVKSVKQKDKFESIHDDYELKMYDHWSMRYREMYIHDAFFHGLDLNNKKIADIASGSGHLSRVLLGRFPGAEVVGFDISETACEAYTRNTGFPAHQTDFTRPINTEETYDAAMVLGGLHHCVSDIPQAIRNIARLIKPGGVFLMMEPNNKYFLEPIRKLWYRLDPFFDPETEAALDHDDLLLRAAPYFVAKNIRYFGGPGFFAIYNSRSLRIPAGLKNAIAPAIMFVERYFSRLPGRLPYAAFVARWERTDAPVSDVPETERRPDVETT